MAISKRTIIISASGATLILIVAIVGFIWLRMMDIPSELNVAAKEDRKSMGVSKPSDAAATPVVRKKMPAPPPTIIEPVPPPPSIEETTTVSETQPEAAKQASIPEVTPTTEKPVEKKPLPPLPAAKPEPPPAPKVVSAPPPVQPVEKKEKMATMPTDDFLYSLQVGAFLKKQNADERFVIMQQLGHDPYRFETTDPKGHRWHTVRIGQYESLKIARNNLVKLNKTSPFKGVVIKKDSLSPQKSKK